jgi:hypothetical protein
MGHQPKRENYEFAKYRTSGPSGKERIGHKNVIEDIEEEMAITHFELN